MARARRRNARRVAQKILKPALNSRVVDDSEVLNDKNWSVASIAWNKEGNIVILDPRLAQYIRQRTRDDRELEIGIPRKTTKVHKGAAGGENEYDPYPLGDPPVSAKPPSILQLCMCEFIRLHLAVEGPALHVPLSVEPLDVTALPT